MATTASTATASSAQTALSSLQAKRASAQKIVTSLSAGSGVDVVALAQGLADAERVPQENLLNSKISKNEARVSGYSAISFMLKGVKDALTALKDANSFNSVAVSNANTASFSATAASGVPTGNYAVKVNSLAQPQRSLSSGFATAQTSINGGASFSLTFSLNGGTATTVQIAAGSDTLQGVADALNAAKLGVKAQVVNTGEAGTPYKIALTGATGAAQKFELTGAPVTFTRTQTASDASLNVDGVDYVRSGNSISDIISGVTLDLKATSASASSLAFTRDPAQVKDKLTALVTAYNETNEVLNEVTNPDSELDIYGATLVGDSVARQVKSQLREMMLGQSSSPGVKVGALWQMGISVDKTGVMSVDNTKLDAALADNFDDVVKTFTADQNNRTATSPPITTSGSFTSASQALNGGAAFSLSLSSTGGTLGIEIPADKSTPQGVVDAINASNSGYVAQLINDGSATAPFKIVVMGGLGGSSFNLTASAAGATVDGVSFTAQGSGIAGDALRKITALLSPSGPLLSQSEGATAQNAKFKASLDALQVRMEGVLARYTKQFAAMDSLVGSINSQKTSLKNTFDGMMAMYTKD